MNILVLHSASINIIEKYCREYENYNIYICTFKKNEGMFSKFAKEIYLKDEASRINSYEIIDEIEDYINKLNIEKLCFIISNKNCENYENIRVLYDSINFENKVLLNCEMKEKYLLSDFNTYLNELYYENEEVILNNYVKKKNLIKEKTKIKKIMFIYDSFYMGGVTNLIYEWIQRMKDDFEIVLSCYSNGSQMSKFENLSKINLYIYKINVFESNASIDYHNYLHEVMLKEKPEAVFIFGVSTFLPSIIASLDSGIPNIYPIANISYYEIFGSINIGKYLRIFSEKYTKIICVSNAVKKSLLNLGVSDNKIDVIYGSTIDINKIKTFDYNDTNKKIISCICRVSKEKGIDTLIKAVSKINKKKYDDFEVYIVGDGEEKSNLLKLAEDYNVADIISFLGYRNDIENILNKTYISVLPSHHEGLPLSILESMAYGKMVIATDVDGIPEVIKHKENGLLIHENDIETLAKYIEICLDNKEFVDSMNYNAQKVIGEKFNIDICIEKLNRLLMGD